MEDNQYKKMELRLQKMDMVLNENQLRNQANDVRNILLQNHLGYRAQISAVIYTLMGSFLGIFLSNGSLALAFFIGIIALSLMIYQNLDYKKKQKDFFELHRDVKVAENYVVKAVDKVDNMIKNK